MNVTLDRFIVLFTPYNIDITLHLKWFDFISILQFLHKFQCWLIISSIISSIVTRYSLTCCLFFYHKWIDPTIIITMMMMMNIFHEGLIYKPVCYPSGSLSLMQIYT